MTPIRIASLLCALALAACDKTDTAPSSTSSASSGTSPSRISESFEATLSRGDSSFYSFTAGAAGTVTVTLASVSPPGRSVALATPLRIGLGTPAGEGCDVTDTVEAMPALTPQLSVSMGAGIHCVWVADSGGVSETVLAAVRFGHL